MSAVLGRPTVLTPEQIVQLREFWIAGRRVIDMAFEFGVSRSTLNRVILDHQFPPRPKPRTVAMSREKRVAVPTKWRCQKCLSIHSGVCPRCAGVGLPAREP